MKTPDAYHNQLLDRINRLENEKERLLGKNEILQNGLREIKDIPKYWDAKGWALSADLVQEMAEKTLETSSRHNPNEEKPVCDQCETNEAEHHYGARYLCGGCCEVQMGLEK